MADKGKKKGKGGDKPAKKSDEVDEKPKASTSSDDKKDTGASAKSAHDDHDHDDAHHDHGHAPAKAHGAGGHAHAHAPNRKEYVVIFIALAVLTVLEVGVAKVPGIGHSLMVVALIGLALTKAAAVALYFMHLKHETKVLKLTVFIPLATPAIYAVVLITEAAWRLTRG